MKKRNPLPTLASAFFILHSAFSLLAPTDASAQTWRWSNPLPHGNDILDMVWNGTNAVQVALDRRDNGGEAAAAPGTPAAGPTRQ